ncbi:hypothetical protein [Acinetobacter terrae]|uniref:NERD domain-containing protein n=2 Tax=Acinetobacter terrae TaxID=2731247 RepID=A0ABX1V1G0_9GAMM|nr:hypothetical protein [Acinetobacter terrae]NNH17402.1 hypothetical protein [Acinetobacter terrae]NNH86304.1 hypothetical protein [Acinetobacter terrae]OAL76960.1 hypothetical protein AY608_08245 [Acinetobacter terrae]
MKNYYEEKFETLFLTFGAGIAKEKIVEDLLYKSTQPKIGLFKNKFDIFWQSNFIKLLTVDEVQSENYILALSQYIRYTITVKEVCIDFIKLDVESFILAVRYSGIILNSAHNSWNIVKEIDIDLSIHKISSFLRVVEKLQSEYVSRLEEYEVIKKELSIGQVTAMIFSSLYAYEYLIPHRESIEQLPYQYDLNENNSAESVWKAFDNIVKTSRKNKKVITEKSLGLALKSKMIPFLTSEGLTEALIVQYETFKKLVAIKIEIQNYQRNVFESFSFNSNVNYELKDKKLIHSNKKEKKDYWDEKNSLLLSYWFMKGSQKLLESDYIYRISPTGKNLEANAIALSKAFAVKEQLRQIYGINDLKINNVDLDLFDVMKTMALSQAHYLKDHIEKFEGYLLESNSHLKALTKLMMHGLVTGENRMPMTFAWQKDKSKRMSSWIIEGSNNQKIKKINQILNFWSCDLYDDNDDSNFSQKPFYKIDEMIFEFPWLTAFQNLNTSMINYVRKLHKNRLELKNETDQIELNLAEKFKKAGFQVFPQYFPKTGNAGEIDLIAIYENHVVVMEIKSSYIRSSIKEIYEYRNFTLNKAAYQLTKKVEYVKSEFLREYFENSEELKIHSWIIDTTLEFDHLYFGEHLKVSLDEVIISLTLDHSFMNRIIESDLDAKDEKVQINGIEFINNIGNNKFWNEQLGNYEEYIGKMSAKFAI